MPCDWADSKSSDAIFWPTTWNTFVERKDGPELPHGWPAYWSYRETRRPPVAYSGTNAAKVLHVSGNIGTLEEYPPKREREKKDHSFASTKWVLVG